MIELNSVIKQYGSLAAVDNVSFSVKAGEYFALLGPNGAGKTTIVKMLLDFTQPTAGSLSVMRQAAPQSVIWPRIIIFLHIFPDGSICNAVRNYWI